jgi:adenylate cyclase
VSQNWATRRARRRRRGLLLAAATLASLAIAVLLQATGVIASGERATVDARFSVRGSEPTPTDVAVVGIDADTFRRTGHYPFSRTWHAKVIDALRADGAKVIAYDVQFTEPTNPRADGALIDAIDRAHGKVVLATTEVAPDGSTGVLGGGPLLRQIGASVGNGIFPEDPGAVIRRAPYSYQRLRSFSAAAASLALGHPLRAADYGPHGAWIDFHGPPGSVPTVSMATVLAHAFRPGTFRGKVVVVGATAPSLQDLSATSTSGSGQATGPEIQAEAISTALRGFPLHGTPSWLATALMAAFALLAPLLGLRVRPVRAFGLALGVGLLWLVAAQLAFDAGRILPVVAPLTGLLVSAVASLAVLVVVTSFERERIRDFFGRFVPEAVVDQVVAQADENLRLGGVRGECTVVFTDLRGFTTFSERKEPEFVIDILNDYLGEMSDAILDEGGTLVAYLGDGIMSVFGAPVTQDDHADRALRAAREMLVRLERFNARHAKDGLAFRMGIGINTGDVMAGNVGSSRRLEFTTIGDAVNTASRLEGMTKGTPFVAFIADSTIARMAVPPTDLVFVDDMAVRGREESIRLWGLIDPLDSGDDAQSAGKHRERRFRDLPDVVTVDLQRDLPSVSAAHAHRAYP